MKNKILNNIVREVDAIRGYIMDPIDGDYILDEIRHIEELCVKLREVCAGEPAAHEEAEYETEEGEDHSDEVDETNYNPYTGQDDGPQNY